MVPICTPDFAARYDLSENTRSLVGVPVIDVREETTDPGWLNWASWSNDFGVAYEERPDTPVFPRLSSGLRGAGEGLGLVLCGMVESFSSLTDGTMVMPFGPKSATRSEFSYWLLSLRRRNRPETQTVFRDWISAEAESYRQKVDFLLGQ